MNTLKALVAGATLASCLTVASCGTTTEDRALSGGLLGAAGGAAIGSVTGSAGRGAVIGGVLGAAAGAIIPPDQVNLGDPAWRESHHCVTYDRDGNCTQWAAN